MSMSEESNYFLLLYKYLIMKLVAVGQLFKYLFVFFIK